MMFDMFRRLQGRMYCSADDGADNSGGGGGGAGGGADKGADLAGQLAALQAELAGLRAKDKQASDSEREKATEAERKKMTEAQKLAEKALEREGRALGLAKTALVRAHLGGLADPEYIKLVPSVEMDDAGNLTPESVKALDAWRAKHPNLFRGSGAAGSAYTPGGAGSGAGQVYGSEEARALQSHGIDLGKLREARGKDPRAASYAYNRPKEA